MKFEPEGKLLLSLGTKGRAGDTSDQFDRPTDVAIAPTGEFYVTDGYGNARVLKLDRTGKLLNRLLASCSDETVRDGKRALELATKANALTGGKNASVLDALAAASAETGNFEKAVEYHKRALADPAFERESGKLARERLKLYEQKKPWRE